MDDMREEMCVGKGASEELYKVTLRWTGYA